MLVVSSEHLFLSLNKSTKLTLWHKRQKCSARNEQVVTQEL